MKIQARGQEALRRTYTESPACQIQKRSRRFEKMKSRIRIQIGLFRRLHAQKTETDSVVLWRSRKVGRILFYSSFRSVDGCAWTAERKTDRDKKGIRNQSVRHKAILLEGTIWSPHFSKDGWRFRMDQPRCFHSKLRMVCSNNKGSAATDSGGKVQNEQER